MLADASLDMSTAPAVRLDVRPDEPDRFTAIDFKAAVLSVTVNRTSATLLQNARISVSISTRRRSCSDIAAFLRSAWMRSVMSSWVPIQSGPLGRSIDDRNGTAIGASPRSGSSPVPAVRRENFGAIVFRVNVEATGRYAVVDQVDQRAARFHNVGRQTIHLDVAILADKDTLIGVEQDDPLGHVVDYYREKCADLVQSRGCEGTDKCDKKDGTWG